MTNEDISLQETVNSDLRDAMVPRPEDLLSDISPVACIWYLQEVAAYALMAWTAEIANQAGEDPGMDMNMARSILRGDIDRPGIDNDIDQYLSDALQALGEIVGDVTALCIRIGLMVDDAQ